VKDLSNAVPRKAKDLIFLIETEQAKYVTRKKASGYFQIGSLSLLDLFLLQIFHQ
jgi:hypothetical protein